MIKIKCFNLVNDDVEIKNNKIVMTSDNELMRQKIQKILSTNKNEWFGNSDEGINFHNILNKNVTDEEVKSEILDGLLQVDSSFIISDFNMELDTEKRELNVSFTATNAEGDTIEVDTSW